MTSHIAVANDLKSLVAWLDGKKTYVGCLIGAAAVVAVHFGIPVPGVEVDPSANWLLQLWGLYMVWCGRSAVAKLAPSTPTDRASAMS